MPVKPDIPHVTVLMPVRNGLPYLRDALASIAAQTFQNFELVVVDDGSSDGTSEALGRHDDPRLRVLRTTGIGIAAALNAGLKAARGRHIARHDADDLSHPERLAIQAQFLDDHPGVGVVGTRVEFIDEQRRNVDSSWTRDVRRIWEVAVAPGEIRALMPQLCCLVHGSVMARREIFEQARGYRPELEPAEDYDLWLRLLPECGMARIPRALYTYRVHADQSSVARKRRQLEQTITAKLQYLRRTAEVPFPARLAIEGTGEGAEVYRRLSLNYGFIEVPSAGNWDVLIVTNFEAIPRYERDLLAGRGAELVRDGNFFFRPKTLAETR